MGNFFCTAGVGSAVAMKKKKKKKNLGLHLKGLPELLLTPNTMQTCDSPPDSKQRLRPECMIVVIIHDEINRALKKRNRNGDTNVPTQMNGRPRNFWLIESGGTPLTPGSWI
jgi:hypothetical protein